MNKPIRKHVRASESDECDVKRLLHELIQRSPDPCRILEVYYWATEPNLAEFIRQFLALSDSARATLMGFMNMTRSAGASIEVTIGLKGEITLSSPAVSDAMQLRSAASIPPEPPEFLH